FPVTGGQTCALPIYQPWHRAREARQHLDVVVARNRQYRYPGGHQFLDAASEVTVGFEVVVFVVEHVTSQENGVNLLFLGAGHQEIGSAAWSERVTQK